MPSIAIGGRAAQKDDKEQLFIFCLCWDLRRGRLGGTNDERLENEVAA
jgi:hypothetical protein